MMSPELIDQAPILAGAPYNIARVWGIADYPAVTLMFRRAFDARHEYDGFGQFCYPIFADAGIGLDGYGRLIKFTLTQFSGIDAGRHVTPEEALQYLMIEVEREERWLASIYATLSKWGGL